MLANMLTGIQKSSDHMLHEWYCS